MSIEPEYELKFHIYDGNEREVERYKEQYRQLREENREEGSVMSRVLSYFFEGLGLTVTADKLFWEQNYSKAAEKYQEANRMFKRFNNSRNVQARLDHLADRMVQRSDGMISICKAYLEEDNNKENLFTEALKSFNKEVELANKMEETMSSYAAFARASFAESNVLLYSAKKIMKEDSGEAKKSLMNARGSIRQATFIDPRYNSTLIKIEDELDDLTKSRIIEKAEEFADKATINQEDGNFEQAIQLFRKASVFYERASSLASDTSSRRFLLASSTIYQSSELEAEGNRLFRRDNVTSEAAEKYSEAAKYVDKAIALMGRFGSDELEKNFTSQRDYYKAMSMQVNAINLFDADQYTEAKSLFEESLGIFNKAIKGAESGDNDVIISLSKEAIGDIKSYISMCEMMM